MRIDAGALETRLSVEWRARSESQREELVELRESIARLTTTARDRELHASLATYRFVPGSSPLSDGMIGFLTRRNGGNIQERQSLSRFF
jgi:hypothetical protein